MRSRWSDGTGGRRFIDGRVGADRSTHSFAGSRRLRGFAWIRRAIASHICNFNNDRRRLRRNHPPRRLGPDAGIPAFLGPRGGVGDHPLAAARALLAIRDAASSRCWTRTCSRAATSIGCSGCGGRGRRSSCRRSGRSSPATRACSGGPISCASSGSTGSGRPTVARSSGGRAWWRSSGRRASTGIRVAVPVEALEARLAGLPEGVSVEPTDRGAVRGRQGGRGETVRAGAGLVERLRALRELVGKGDRSG